MSSRLEWAVGGFFAAWAAARLTGADRFRPLEQWSVPVLSLTPQAAAGAAIAVRCAELAGSTGSTDLWAAAAGLVTSTLFGPFGIDVHTGAQARHQTVLTRWTAGRLALHA